MVTIPVRILKSPPSNLATLGSALNLAVLLEIHREDLQERGRRQIRTSRSFVFTKLTALAIHLAYDRSQLDEDTGPWLLACQLLLPVEALAVKFKVQVTDSQEDEIDAAAVLRNLQMEHHSVHGRQPNDPASWTVSRVALEAGHQTVAIPCSLTTEPLLPREMLPTAAEVEASSAYGLINKRRYEVAHHLDPLPSGLSANPVHLVASELHVVFLDLMHDIAYKRYDKEREVAFFGLYLLSAHILILEHHHRLDEPLHHSLRKLYLRLPRNGTKDGDGGEKTQSYMRGVEMTARSLPQFNPDFFEDQRNWHLNLRAQGGTGGMRDPERLRLAYKQFYEAALKTLMMAIEGPSKHPSKFPSSAFALGKSAYHPVSRRAYM